MTRFLVILVCGFLMLAMQNEAARADDINQLVLELQKNPKDDALREKIIKQAQTDIPAIPEDARRNFIKGTTHAKNATDSNGQLLAVKSFQHALKLAPWWGDAYYNLAVAQELAGQYSDAKSSLKFYVLTQTNEKEKREAQDRIYALEAKDEAKAVVKTQAATAVAKKKISSPEEEFLRSLDGKVFTYEDSYDTGYAINYSRRKVTINHNEMILTTAIWNAQQTPQDRETDRVKLSKSVQYNSSGGDVDPACNPMNLTISDDGSRIIHRHNCFGRTIEWVYRRTN